MSTLELATRGSPLALWQAHCVAERLRAVHADLEVEIVEVRTEGDRVQDRPLEQLSQTGVFTKEVDARVIAGDAHVAVHSLKDQVTTLPDGIVLGMVLGRGPVEDVLIGRTAATLATLPAGGRVATGSLRRRAQILRAYPRLECVPIRGNVEGRLKKLDAGAADAIVLARAGIVRLGLANRITEIIAPDVVLPAVSQGIVGVTCRADDLDTAARLHAAEDGPARAAADAERAWLCRLGGGCNVPAAAHATVSGDRIHVRARVLAVDGGKLIEDEIEGAVVDAAALGDALARTQIDQGAAELVRECRA